MKAPEDAGRVPSMGWNWTLHSPLGRGVATAAYLLSAFYCVGLLVALYWLTTRP